jgi:hypothetical protein
LQDFSDKNKREQFILSRANSMAVSASNVMRDLKALMQNPDYSPDALSTAIDNLNKGTVAGSGIYTNLANDLLAFTQEDQAVRSGTPTVTETGEQVRTVQRLWVPGSVEQIRGFLSHNIETANARITGDQTWWKRMHGYGTMVGYVPEASAVITAMQHLNEKTGKYDNLPQGYTLPPDLAASMPTDSENARAVTAASTGSAQTAPTNPSWATGSATGPQGRKLYKGSDGHWYNPDHTLAQ